MIHLSKFLFGIMISTSLFAEESTAGSVDIVDAAARFLIHNVWMLVATFLVFIMHLGFASLETGLTRSKNTVNILFKNVFIIAIGILTYALMGFSLMYPDFTQNAIWGKLFGFAGFGIQSPEGEAGLIQYADGTYTYWTDFLFQAMFAATAATIMSGAVAERIKLWPFLIGVSIYVAFIYPIVGSWKWGGGWLDELGFYDFAGSTLVHSVGGWAALIGIILLGPRLSKYSSDGTIKPIHGHNMPLVTIGVFLLWFGWFGFNGGSVLSADPGPLSLVLVNTTLAAAAGIVGSALASALISGSPDLSMVLNGSLAGLVGITAGADVVSPLSSVVIGAIAGFIVVYSVVGLDTIKLDDPVGAVSVHLVCGIWGTLAVGIFSVNPEHSLMNQLIGVLSIGAFSFGSAFIIFGIIKAAVGIRVSREEEIKGLDLAEHEMESYAGFQIFSSD